MFSLLMMIQLFHDHFLQFHSLVATASGDLYVCGRGREGQLGLGGGKLDIACPEIVKGLRHERIVEVAAGAMASYAITATGRLYHWYNTQSS